MAELRDLRGKITVETDQVLEAIARSQNKDKSEIVRDVMHEWALAKVHEATLVVRLTRCEGSGKNHEGTPGNIARMKGADGG